MIKRENNLIIIIFLMLVFMFSSCKSDRSENSIEKAKDYIDILQYNKAKKILIKITADDPHNEEALINLAFVYYQLKEYNNSKKICISIKEIAPKNTYNNYMLGRIYIYEKNYKMAMNELKRCFNEGFRESELKFKNDAYYQLGYSYEQLGENEKALKNYKNAFEGDRNIVKYCFAYAEILKKLKRNKEAINVYNFICGNPSFSQNYQKRAVKELNAFDSNKPLKSNNQIGWNYLFLFLVFFIIVVVVLMYIKKNKSNKEKFIKNISVLEKSQKEKMSSAESKSMPETFENQLKSISNKQDINNNVIKNIIYTKEDEKEKIVIEDKKEYEDRQDDVYNRIIKKQTATEKETSPEEMSESVKQENEITDHSKIEPELKKISEDMKKSDIKVDIEEEERIKQYKPVLLKKNQPVNIKKEEIKIENANIINLSRIDKKEDPLNNEKKEKDDKSEQIDIKFQSNRELLSRYAFDDSDVEIVYDFDDEMNIEFGTDEEIILKESDKTKDLQKKEKEEKKYEKIINQGFSGKNDEINNKNIPKIVYENGINIEEKRRSGIPKEPVDIRILKYEKKFFSKYENITDDQLKKRRRELLSSENIEKNSRFYNPVIFEEIFEIEVITSIRKRYNLSFGMFELSGLKKIIEKLPEDQKKPMIRDIYEMIKSFIRDELDIPILLSSDCYAVIFNQTDIKNALEIIDVYLNTVKSISIDNEKLNLLYGITELNEKALSPKIMYEQVVKKLKIS